MVAGKGHVSMPWSLKHRVIQVGPRRDLERYYAAADVLVHPTFYDPCANVCLEAMAAGVPVLTTDWNGASELIHSGQEGFIYHNPADVAALSDALLAFSDRNRREAMRVKARKAVERLTPENHLARVEALLLDVVREKQSSPVPPSQKELP